MERNFAAEVLFRPASNDGRGVALPVAPPVDGAVWAAECGVGAG